MKKLMLLSAVAVFSAGVSHADNRVVEISDSEKVQIFDEPGTHSWVAPNNLVGTAQLLVVGGGGAGGGRSGGGGGGGEVKYIEAQTLEAGKTYTITVAAGGVPDDGLNSGGNGGESSIADVSSILVSAIGGGGGGGGWSPVVGKDGANGGGAGGNGNQSAMSGGKPTVEGGHKGADSFAKNYAYGGGGGMGEDGHVYDDLEKPGYGGAGVVYYITGTDKMYGYGGGACRDAYSPALSGAGDEFGAGAYELKNIRYINATDGEAGTGGGGGGGVIQQGPGGHGGCGTVIIRYTIDTAKDDFSANITRSIKVPTTVTFTAELGTELSVMTWDFGDGSDSLVTTDLSVSHEYTAAGKYTVTMTHGAQTVTKTEYVEIISGTLFVDANSTNPQPPYDTRETAATTVNDAMAYAENGFEVRIAPGDYPLNEKSDTGTQYIDVTNAVYVIGEGSSPTDVVLRSVNRRTWYNDKVMRINNAGATVVNVTLADGSVSNGGWGGCLLIDAQGGTVSNCVIRNGWANKPGQAMAGGAYLNAGLVTHSVFEDCKFSGMELGNTPMASAARLHGTSRIENCLFRGCTGEVGVVVAVMSDFASVVNCTVVDSQIGFWTGNNNVTNDGYAVCCSAGTVKNCAVYNVKRLAYNDNPETYDCAFGSDLSKFTYCVKAEKADFRDYDNGNLIPAPDGALLNKGDNSAFPDAGATDLAGKPRIVGRKIDIGCYEAPTQGLTIYIR